MSSIRFLETTSFETKEKGYGKSQPASSAKSRKNFCHGKGPVRFFQTVHHMIQQAHSIVHPQARWSALDGHTAVCLKWTCFLEFSPLGHNQPK